jgi:hypothetical protein
VGCVAQKRKNRDFYASWLMLFLEKILSEKGIILMFFVQVAQKYGVKLL